MEIGEGSEMKTKAKEFWNVIVKSRKYDGDHYELYVYARNAAEAERRALAIEKTDSKVADLYCFSAAFAGYVE
jgi:hypothetical protein